MKGKPLLATLALTAVGVLCGTDAARGLGSCTITAVGVSFGTYDVFGGSPLDSTGSVTYNCLSVLGTITIDLSRGGAPTFSPRRMLRSAETLNYNLYLDAARMTIWGNATSGTSHYGPVTPPLLTNVTVTIYGRIPAGQDVSAGSYTDTVVATINF
jgi:spore coat protein U-like protein